MSEQPSPSPISPVEVIIDVLDKFRHVSLCSNADLAKRILLALEENLYRSDLVPWERPSTS